jgi:phosphohistidine swiveling domain-containing protein
MSSWTKAETLTYLRTRLRQSIVDNQLVFTIDEWRTSTEAIIGRIQETFSDRFVIVRSSALDEDKERASRAGYYHSEPNVPCNDRGALIDAIRRVASSYSRDGRTADSNDQILIQPHIQDVLVSGVALTRDPKSNSPYYLIDYDETGRTDLVTRGLAGRAIRIANWLDNYESLDDLWRNLFFALKELERFWPGKLLDIEFAVDRNRHVHVFQVRPFPAQPVFTETDDLEVKAIVERLSHDSERMTERVRNLLGSRTIFADMVDWNPAEIIGSRPNMLDYSLYRLLITKSVWNQARVSLGYTDVAPCELMVVLAGKPYIDTRVSFNSLTPSTISPSLGATLTDYYLDKLARHPELQDKVEFELVFSCLDLSFRERTVELRRSGFSESDISDLENCLVQHTNSLLLRAGETMNEDLENIGRLERRRENRLEIRGLGRSPAQLMDRAHKLLIDCRDLGAFSFARVARLAFIGRAVLKSLLERQIVDQAFFHRFMNSIVTVASQLRDDLDRLARGSLSLSPFMETYGHLRPGTYNILAPRYDHMRQLFVDLARPSAEPRPPPSILTEEATVSKIDAALHERGIQCTGQDLMAFMRKTIECREYAKFVFTKALSDALELIGMAGSQLGFTREQLSSIDIETLLQLRGSEDPARICGLWRDVAQKNQVQKALDARVLLPPIVASAHDFKVVRYYQSRPNFVTNKSVQGSVCNLSSIDYRSVPDLTDRILLIENADPGYDWVFARSFKGLITEYGGVASHMAIRCAEFGIPAALGCGEVLFERLKAANLVHVDCVNETIVPVY